MLHRLGLKEQRYLLYMPMRKMTFVNETKNVSLFSSHIKLCIFYLAMCRHKCYVVHLACLMFQGDEDDGDGDDDDDDNNGKRSGKRTPRRHRKNTPKKKLHMTMI